MKEKTNAVIVVGMLFPIEMKRAKMSHENPKRHTCIMIGNQACLNDPKRSIIGFGNFFLIISQTILAKDAKKRMRNPILSRKLTTFNGSE